MISYLVKFNNLPKELRDKVSSKEAMTVISNLEKKYATSLASVVMRVMVRDLTIDSLLDFFVREHSFDKKQAEELVRQLKEKVFFLVGEYLGIVDDKIQKKNESQLPVPLNEVPRYFTKPKNNLDKVTTQEDKELSNWMSDRKSDMAPRDSSFFFSPEDEEEVKMLAKKVAGFSTESKKQQDAGEGLEKVLKSADVNFTSEDMKNRFEQVIKTYLHGVRNRVDTKQTLIKSTDVGGLGIDNSIADKILQSATAYRREPEQPTLKTPSKIVAPEDASASGKTEEVKSEVKTSGDVAYDFSALISGKENKQEAEKAEVEFKKEVKKEDSGIAPLKREKSTYVESEKKTEEEKDEFIDLTKLENLKDDRTIDIGKKMRAQTMSMKGDDRMINIVQARAAASTDGRVKMEDVKHVPKLTGPIDELKEMNIINFRRLSENPREAVLKIKKKIGFLEEESYTKRFEGIKAWRQSPINKLYLEIGQESIINKSSVSVIIEKRKLARKPFLSEQEFRAVMDLNKDLRF